VGAGTVAEAEEKIRAATKAVDQAAARGVLDRKTANRRKARMSRAKKELEASLN